MSLVRHLSWIHLTGGNAMAIATRNCLPANHSLWRLLWPHVYGTQSTNLLTTKSQLTLKGDFEAIFSFTHRDICQLLEDTHDEFDLTQLDPERDAWQRGLLEAGLELPVLENRQALFEVMLAHTSRYLGLYYESDEHLRQDVAFRCWVAELDRLLPRGTRALLGVKPTLGARPGSRHVHLPRLGGAREPWHPLWNYQVWTHVQPVRVYRNGQREPLDVYQRLINANFILNVPRTPLLEDFSRLAPDPKGADAHARLPCATPGPSGPHGAAAPGRLAADPSRAGGQHQRLNPAPLLAPSFGWLTWDPSIRPIPPFLSHP